MEYILHWFFLAVYVGNVITQQYSYDTCAADVVFVVDESGSIGLSNYNNLKDYIRDVVNLLTPTERGHHIGLVSFSNNARLHFKFEYSNLPSKITSIPYADSNTNIADGLDLARTQVLSDTSGRNANRPNYKDIVVLISDGADNMNKRDRVSQAGRDIRNCGGNNNVHVITIGIGGGVDRAQLEDIASDTTEVHYIQSFSPRHLAAEVEAAAQLICKNSQVTTVSPVPNPTGSCQAANSGLILHNAARVVNGNAYDLCHVLVPSESRCQGGCGGSAFVLDPSLGEQAFDAVNMQRSCGCCKPTNFQEHKTCALCRNRGGQWVEENFYYTLISQCSCGDCSGNLANGRFSNQGQGNTFVYNNPSNTADILTNSRFSSSDVLLPRRQQGSFSFNTMYQQSKLRSWRAMYPESRSTRRNYNTINVDNSAARAEIIKKLSEQVKRAVDAQQELGASGTSTERFVREECEAEEEIRSLGKPDDFYDVKKVDACIQKKLGFKENPGIVKDPVGNRTYTS